MKRAALGAMMALLAAPAAMAADYPYSGYFTSGQPGENPDDIRLMCANSFFRQGADGSFVNYHLDAGAYDRDGTLRYVRYGDGSCEASDGERIEACRMAFSTDATEIGTVYVDTIESIAPDIIKLRYFESVEQARSHLGDEAPADELAFFVRCLFSDDAVSAFLTDDVSTLSVEERGAFLTPDLDALSRARMAAILARLKP